MVDTVNQLWNRFVALRRRGDNDLVRAGVEMLGGVVFRPEDAGTLKGDVAIFLAPRQVGWALDVVELHRGAADGELVAVAFEPIEGAHDGVVLAEILHLLELHHVVDADKFDPRTVEDRTERVAPDSPEAVEPDPNHIIFVDLRTSV